MNKLTGFVTLLSVCAVVVAYTDMDDTLNVEELVKDKAKLQTYVDCFNGKQPCTPKMQQYKSHLSEAVFDGCKECNDVERHMLKVFIRALKSIINKTDVEEFKRNFDPNNHLDTTFADIAAF